MNLLALLTYPIHAGKFCLTFVKTYRLLFILSIPVLLLLLYFCCSSPVRDWETMTVLEVHYCVILILWADPDKDSHPEAGLNLLDMGSVDQSTRNCQEVVHYFIEFTNIILTQTSHSRAGVCHGFSYSDFLVCERQSLFINPSAVFSYSHRLCVTSPHI